MKKSKKILLAVSVPFLVLVLLVCALGCLVLIPSSLGADAGDPPSSYGTVLADIDGIVEANPRYIDLAFLGSHDSFSSLITPDSSADDATPSVLKKLLPLLKNYIYRFAVTQNVGIYDQILAGARFFQLKITFYDGEWYTSHTLLSGKLEVHLLDLLRYLTSEHAKGETVGVLFQPVYLGDNTYADLHEYIRSVRYNGYSLYDFVRYGAVDVFNKNTGGIKICELRYNDLTANGTQAGVVLFDRRGSSYLPEWEGSEDTPYSFDLDSNAIHVWHNSTSPKHLTEGIVETYEEIKNDPTKNDLLRVNQTQAAMATNTLSDIWGDLTAGSLLRIAQKHNLSLVERDDFGDILATMPVFQVDYLTSAYGDFNKKANALIRSYNENLCKVSK